MLERVFDRLTQQQLQILELKTSIQRADSFLAASNIRDYSRLQLIIDVLQRFAEVLAEADQARLGEQADRCLKQTSGQYLYQLETDSMEQELRQLGEIYREQVGLRPASELHSGCLQSPDDPDATFRAKAGQTSKGQTIHVAETAHRIIN